MDTTLSKALQEGFRGSLRQLLAHIGGEESEIWEIELRKFNRREPCWVSHLHAPPRIEIMPKTRPAVTTSTASCSRRAWKTIRLGTGLRSAGDFRSAFNRSGCRIYDQALRILDRPAFIAGETGMTVDLVNVSAGELGLDDEAAWPDIVAKALGIGLELCPAEVGPQLRLQYWGQPYGKSLLVAMMPIADLSGGRYVFSVGHDQHGRWLDGCGGDPAEGRPPERSLVFMRPRR